MKNINKSSLFFCLYLFCIIFAPPIIPRINFMLILALFSCWKLMKENKKTLLKICFNSKILFWSLSMLVFIFYVFVVMIGNYLLGDGATISHYIITLYRFGIIVIYLPCVVYVFVWMRKLNYDLWDLVYSLIMAGLIQAGICLASLLIPPFKEALVNYSYFSTGNEIYLNEFFNSRRLYGFSNDVLDSFGFGTGIIASLPLYYSVHTRQFKYIFLIPVLLIVPLLNARTGLIIFGVCFILWIFTLPVLEKKYLKKYLISFALIGFIGVIIVGIVYLINADAIVSTFADILSIFKFVFTGELSTPGLDTASNLFKSSAWYLPSDPLQMIFGSGHTVFSLNDFAHSDVGYINDLWLSGIIGTIGLYSLFFYLLVKSWRKGERLQNMLTLSLTVSLFIFQIKGRAVMYSVGTAVILLIQFYLIYQNNYRGTAATYKSKYKNSPLISVVVPVYKVERYLKDCIDSLLAQTYRNLEIILVDDGSPDNCPQICDDLANQNEQIRVIHQHNQGLSEARNSGLKASKGTYIVFIDSDDYIEDTFIEKLYNAIEHSNSDIGVCAFYYTSEDGKKDERLYHDPCPRYICMNAYEAIQDVFSYPNLLGVTAWNKMYKTNLFIDNDILYPKGMLHEDEFTTYKLLDNAEKIVYVDEPLYHYRQRGNSIMKQNIYTRIPTYEAIIRDIENYYKGQKEYSEIVAAKTLMMKLTVLNLLDFDNSSKEVSKIKQEISGQLRHILKNRYINSIQKLKCLLIAINKN